MSVKAMLRQLRKLNWSMAFIALSQRRTIPDCVISYELLSRRNRSVRGHSPVPSKKTTPIIAEMQERVDEIQTEAVRLAVFASTITNPPLAENLKKIARVVLKSANQIERLLVKLT
jgi:hypothetical protein